jgi:hypothetical protein
MLVEKCNYIFIETADIQNKFMFRYHSALIIDLIQQISLFNYHELSF